MFLTSKWQCGQVEIIVLKCPCQTFVQIATYCSYSETFIFLTAVVVMITLLYHVDEGSVFLESLFTPSQTTRHYDIMTIVSITKPVKTSGYCMCHLRSHYKTTTFWTYVCLFVLCDSQNKPQSFLEQHWPVDICNEDGVRVGTKFSGWKSGVCAEILASG